MEILQTKRQKPLRAIIYGEAGLGKSSLAAAFPDPIFIDLEKGLSEIDAQAFPEPENYQQVIEQLKYVVTEKHSFKTLVIDSIDWLEKIIFEEVTSNAGVKDISDIGYGGGYSHALKIIGQFISGLQAVSKINMHVVLLAHSHIKLFSNPLGPDYDVYNIKLREKNGELFKEWATLVGLLHQAQITKKQEGGFTETHKVLANAELVLSVKPSPAYSAKNRYGITTDIKIPSPQKGWENIKAAVYGKEQKNGN